MGYFSLAIRPVEIPAEAVSKSLGRRLERAGKFDCQKNIYNAAVYLLAQLGKNYTDGANERISGSDMLFVVWKILQDIQYDVG